MINTVANNKQLCITSHLERKVCITRNKVCITIIRKQRNVLQVEK